MPTGNGRLGFGRVQASRHMCCAHHAGARVISIHRVPFDIQVVEVPRDVVVPDVTDHIVTVGHNFRNVGDGLPHVDDDLGGEGRLKMVVDFAPLHWPPTQPYTLQDE